MSFACILIDKLFLTKFILNRQTVVLQLEKKNDVKKNYCFTLFQNFMKNFFSKNKKLGLCKEKKKKLVSIRKKIYS